MVYMLFYCTLSMCYCSAINYYIAILSHATIKAYKNNYNPSLVGRREGGGREEGRREGGREEGRREL